MNIRYNTNRASKYRITCVFILLIVYLNANSNNFNTSVEKQQIVQANDLEIDESARKQQAGVRNYRDEDDDNDKGERRNNGIKQHDQQKQNKQGQVQKQEGNLNQSKESVGDKSVKNQVLDEELKNQENDNREIPSSEKKMTQEIVGNTQQQNQPIKQQNQKTDKEKIVQPQNKQEQNQSSSQKNSKKQIKRNDVSSENRQNNAQNLIDIIQPYFSIFSSCYHSLIASITPLLPQSINKLTQSTCTSIIDYFSRKLLPFIRSYHTLYKLLTHQSKQKQKKVYYQNNFANLYGGAKIIMKSSWKIKSLNSILEDGPDKYMYTDEQLPLKIIIGLNQEIAIDSIIIQSYQMYSCITREFVVEGKFAMEDKKWVYLGSFQAKNVFGDQEFKTERKIVRYVKITFISAYGKWSYFTLTQVKIRGKSLFADALTQQPQTNQKSPSTPSTPTHQQSHKQQQQQRPHRNTCQNKFNPPSTQPHENNLIKSLITKLDRLQTYNTIQNKEMSQLQQKLINVTQKLNEKVEENKMYQNILKQYKKEIDKNYYVIWISLGVSCVTAVFLVCLGLLRRRELGQFRKKEGKGGKEVGAGGFEVKKSNSIK